MLVDDVRSEHGEVHVADGIGVCEHVGGCGVLLLRPEVDHGLQAVVDQAAPRGCGQPVQAVGAQQGMPPRHSIAGRVTTNIPEIVRAL